MRRHPHFHALILLVLLLTTTLLGCQKDVWKSDICLSLDQPQAVCPVCKPAQSGEYPWNREIKEILATAASLQMERQTPDKSTGAIPAPPSTAPAVTQSSNPCVDITSADASTLEKLPGIGPGRAQAILEARNKRPFHNKSDIRRIKGIGKKSFQKLAPHICDIPGRS